jgi:hypothetical protein
MFVRTPPVLLAADFGMGASYSGTQAGSPTSVTLTVKADGTWTITFGGGDTPAGTPTSGNWTASTLAGIGSDYRVTFSTANSVNSPTITNGAATPTIITGDLTISVAKGSANASADVTVSIAPIYGSQTTLTDTANFAANGA